MVENRGCYVYGVAGGNGKVRMGPIGIEGNEVYAIPFRGLCAIVHSCPAQPYQSSDDKVVKSWVRTHQSVLDEAQKQLGTVIPLGFDTILKPREDSCHPEQTVKDWLREDYGRLRALMQRVAGKDEFVLQVSFEPAVLGKQIAEQSQEIQKIKEDMATKPAGVVYLYQQKLEKMVRTAMEMFADEGFRYCYELIKQYCADIIVEKTKKSGKNKVMLLNFSCLVAREKVDSLGAELEEIGRMPGFSVHFSGPWPPYSFVAKPIIPAREEAR